MPGKVNLSIFVPDNTVASMQDELADGSVARAVEAIKAAFLKFDSDGDVEIVEYGNGVHEAIDTALNHAAATIGADLLAVISDLVGDHDAALRRLNALGDDFLLATVVSNQGYNTAFAAELYDLHSEANQIDVVELAKLTDPAIADKKVAPWHDHVAA